MLARLLPLMLALTGLGAGVGAGLALRPPAHANPTDESDVTTCLPAAAAADIAAVAPPEKSGEVEYVKLNNQFVVPVVAEGRVRSLIVLSITLEVAPGRTELVYAREPRIRDAMLQVLFDHANTGGFSGSFTDGTRMAVLRRALREATAKVLGPALYDVLVTDIVRQDA
ncbi:Flagellar basal body-associated protein FliL [Meinhardsimonia xiamenensis]|jgi:hypothetical protein|uniref:Flagellar protein FliL n=1 Tax=Meinhardsimonia xiamenensis TaxID=990712 RepID=A0A1G9E9Z4_9RHOB|nr:flagellar basal body-associated FliL family protein [Meinhardsimonia xiamenensis]PRX33865.1 flagellar basal body-associated protein FliL [Meinhardsimonia xiamenensis]SDK72947.1 Flagellar basal body-associated protein FliL [Meinhardsimonia xiamenensis]